MYSTCLFCHGALGANEAVESFPVGRRLAFDGEKGRLWVVCTACGRWNLSPLEERWEAIEECERLYRDARLRAQTGEIGLAQLPEGMQLVRVGRPHRPEFAAWRYGDALGVRRRKAIRQGVTAGAIGSSGLAVMGGLMGAAAGASVVAPLVLMWGVNVGIQYFALQRSFGKPVKVPTERGASYTVFRSGLYESSLEPGDGEGDFRLVLRHATGFATLEGRDARRALGLVLPKVNSTGARARPVRTAAELIASAGGPDRFLATIAADSARRSEGFLEERAAFRRGTIPWGQRLRWNSFDRMPDGGPVNAGSLPRFAHEMRLATEMALHEESERIALEGELSRLEAEWREAEEIAAIADRLLTAPALEARLAALKRGSSAGSTDRPHRS